MSLFFATRVLDLNVYQRGAELLDAQLRTLSDPYLGIPISFQQALGSLLLVLLLWARNDASHLAPWKGLIANLRAAGQSGAVESEASALRSEYDYLRRSGQSMEAERTLEDFRRLTDSTQRR
ncbi:MAG: hypothetical protein ABI837_02790 [Acidobacteriota bacterium]